jgi:hypothetical protein
MSVVSGAIATSHGMMPHGGQSQTSSTGPLILSQTMSSPAIDHYGELKLRGFTACMGCRLILQNGQRHPLAASRADVIVTRPELAPHNKPLAGSNKTARRSARHVDPPGIPKPTGATTHDHKHPA